MRISDWSSDVCSSDLLGKVAQQVVERGAELHQPRIARLGDARMLRLAGGAEQQRVAGRGIAVDGDAVERLVGALAQQRLQQLGRQARVGRSEAASCRERGCQYVLI